MYSLMKRFFSIVLYAILVAIISCLAWNNITPRPIKFENFKNNKEAKSFLDQLYPRGTDIRVIMHDLNKVGAKCIKRPEKIPPQEMGEDRNLAYEAVYVCDYYNNFLSLDPLSMYSFYLFFDRHDRLVGISVNKSSRIEIP